MLLRMVLMMLGWLFDGVHGGRNFFLHFYQATVIFNEHTHGLQHMRSDVLPRKQRGSLFDLNVVSVERNFSLDTIQFIDGPAEAHESFRVNRPLIEFVFESLRIGVIEAQRHPVQESSGHVNPKDIGILVVLDLDIHSTLLGNLF